MNVSARDIRTSGRPMAVFDVDETLIWEKSMFSFLRFFMQSEHGEKTGLDRYDAFASNLNKLSQTAPREVVNRSFYEVFQDQRMSKLTALAQSWFAQQPVEKWFIPEVLATLRVHQQHGHRIVLLSGSALFILAPLATALAPDDVLAINLGETPDGICTGKINGIQTIGAGKLDALRAILLDGGDDPVSSCFGYGDHESDAPFLDACDAGFVVWHSGAKKRPSWAQRFHPIIINSKPMASLESYANA